jgi:hypothetical protein
VLERHQVEAGPDPRPPPARRRAEVAAQPA